MEQIDLSEHEKNLLANPDDFTGEDFYQAYLNREYNKEQDKLSRKRKAAVFLVEAGRKKHGKALFVLYNKSSGGDYESGIEQNKILSIKFLRWSAEAGYLDAAFSLSAKLWVGSPEEGIEKDIAESSHWLKISAGYKISYEGVHYYSSEGSPKAKTVTAMKYLSGRDGFPKDISRYLKLLEQASRRGIESGDQDAQKELFFAIMRLESRKIVEQHLSKEQVRTLQEQFTQRLPGHHPMFKMPVVIDLANNFLEFKKRESNRNSHHPEV
jgi:TPR repeat protein